MVSSSIRQGDTPERLHSLFVSSHLHSKDSPAFWHLARLANQWLSWLSNILIALPAFVL